jgi:hypothetical protein
MRQRGDRRQVLGLDQGQRPLAGAGMIARKPGPGQVGRVDRDQIGEPLGPEPDPVDPPCPGMARQKLGEAQSSSSTTTSSRSAAPLANFSASWYSGEL